jgi:Protein of unknown function (DUF4232)
MLALGMLGVTGCSASHPGGRATAVGSTAVSGTSPRPSSRPRVIPPSSGKCRTSDLAFTIQPNVQKEDPLAAVVIKNTTSLTCTLQGYFDLVLLDGGQRPVGPAPRREDQLGGFSAQPAPLVLVPQSVVQFLYQWDDAPSAGPCVQPVGIQLTAPDQADHVVIPARTAQGAPVAPCGPATAIGPAVVVP